MPKQKKIKQGTGILQQLLAGNKRFRSGRMLRGHQDQSRREEVAQSQRPVAVILACADSRVPPEIIFDQGLGDLFVVRSAGQVLDDAVLGSMEYAVAHLHTPLLLVLGHKRCGAVQAVVQGRQAPGRINALIKAIKPVVDGARAQAGDLVDNAVKGNVRLLVRKLESSAPILREAVAKKELEIIGAYYDLDTGAVEVVSG